MAGVKAGMSPLLGGRQHCVIPYGMWVSIVVRLVENCYTPFTLYDGLIWLYLVRSSDVHNRPIMLRIVVGLGTRVIVKSRVSSRITVRFRAMASIRVRDPLYVQHSRLIAEISRSCLTTVCLSHLKTVPFVDDIVGTGPVCSCDTYRPTVSASITYLWALQYE